MKEADEILVVKAQQGHRDAFEELVRRTSRLVFAHLYLETGNRHQAEDLLQETLMRAWRWVKHLRDPEQWRSWLMTIAKNAMLDSVRNQSRLKRRSPPRESSESLKLVSANCENPEEAAERTELRGQVIEALRAMPEEYRWPITLRYISGADYGTIETQLGLTNGSLRGLLRRGLKMLRQKLEAEFGEMPE